MLVSLFQTDKCHLCPSTAFSAPRDTLGLLPPQLGLNRVETQNLGYSVQPEKGTSDQRPQLPWSDQVQGSAFTPRSLLRLASPNHQPESFLQSTLREGLAPASSTLQEALGNMGFSSAPGIEALTPHIRSRDK